MTDQDITLIKAARESQRRKDAAALEAAARTLTSIGRHGDAAVLMAAALSILAPSDAVKVG